MGIFLPGFGFVAASGRSSRASGARPSPGAFLDGVNVASLALMAVVTVQLGRAALVDALTVVRSPLASAGVLIRFKPNTTWLVAGGAVVGIVATALR